MNHLNTNAQAPSARALAYQALYDILEKGAYSNLRLQTALKKNHLKGPEAHLLTELVYGTLRKYKYLIWIISRLSSHPVKDTSCSSDPVMYWALSADIFIQDSGICRSQ